MAFKTKYVGSVYFALWRLLKISHWTFKISTRRAKKCSLPLPRCKAKGVTRRSKGSTIPGAPNHYGGAASNHCKGHRKVPIMSQVLSSTAHLLSKDFRFGHGSDKLVSCPGRHL